MKRPALLITFERTIQRLRLRIHPRTLARLRTSDVTMILVAAVIGIVTGGVILLFNAATQFAGDSFEDLFELSRTMRWWDYLLFPLVPATGGLLVGILNTWVFKRRSQHGVPDVIRASRFARGSVGTMAGLQTLLTASLSIGSGGGGGREGPIVHVGAAAGSLVARVFRFGADHTRTLLTCGAAAGISGIFNAPMGGVMFALEIILGDFRLRTFTPVMVASVSATAIMRTVRGDEALIHPTTAIQIFLPEYLLFALLGVAAGFLSVWFIRSLSAVERACTRILTMHAALRPAVGGLLAGILAVFMPALLEQTYHPINMALDGGYAWWMLLGVALVKPLHTALTTGSGGTGGSFAPALKSGAMLGALFGAGVMQVFPSMVTSPTAYALAGMGAVLAGTMQAPLTGILMLVEISNNYTIVLPGMLTAILASVIAQRVARRSVYGGALERDGRKEGSYAYLPLLSSLAIEPVVAHDAPRVHLDTPLREVLHDFEASVHDAVLVIDARDRYLGLIEFDDLRPVMSDLSMLDSLVAADVMTTDVTPVRIDTTMDVVLRLHDRKGWRVLPVLDVDDERALGLLAVSDAHTYYRRSVAREV